MASISCTSTSVLDRDRRPVRGRTPADFTLLADGVRQQISVFTAVEIGNPEPPAAAWVRNVASDVRTNEGVDERRLFLIIMDDAMIQADPKATRNARDIARKVVERMGPSALAAVVFTLDNRKSQDYTDDRERLLAAVNKFGGGFRDTGRRDDLYWVYSAGVVQRAAEVLVTLPDRRKSMVCIGTGSAGRCRAGGAASPGVA